MEKKENNRVNGSKISEPAIEKDVKKMLDLNQKKEASGQRKNTIFERSCDPTDISSNETSDHEQSSQQFAANKVWRENFDKISNRYQTNRLDFVSSSPSYENRQYRPQSNSIESSHKQLSYRTSNIDDEQFLRDLYFSNGNDRYDDLCMI